VRCEYVRVTGTCTAIHRNGTLRWRQRGQRGLRRSWLVL